VTERGAPTGWLIEGMPVLVTKYLPYDLTDSEGRVVGKRHWVAIDGQVLCSEEAFARLKGTADAK
jgi:hypothetical protein